jgi:hypothetical protein
MAVAANPVETIPVDISLDYFKNVTVSSRAKERGYNFFINGYVHAVKLYHTSEKKVEIAAKCYRSMKKSEAPHKVNMTIDCNACVIDESHCSCQAG